LRHGAPWTTSHRTFRDLQLMQATWARRLAFLDFSKGMQSAEDVLADMISTISSPIS